MRDAAGQLPDRFHLLRMPQHVLRLAPMPAFLRQRGFGETKLGRRRQGQQLRHQRPQDHRGDDRG